MGLDIYPRCAAMNILVDHDVFDNISRYSGWEGRVSLQAYDQGPTAWDGVTISNNHFAGGCSDGGGPGISCGPSSPKKSGSWRPLPHDNWRTSESAVSRRR